MSPAGIWQTHQTVLTESFETINPALIGGYCNFTTTLLATLLSVLDKKYDIDTRGVLQDLFLKFESE